MAAGGMRRLSGVGSLARQYKWAIPVGIIAGLLLAGFFMLRWMGSWFEAPAPQTIASASLQSMREQQRLTTLSARYVAVVTSTQTRAGGALEARKRLIMPGDVRYEVDLAALRQEDLRWDEGTRTLSVTLPPLQISQPAVDLNAVQEIRNNSLLFTLTDAERTLDGANRDAALRSLAQQAQQALPIRTARESAKRAIARSFAMPLRAAGLEVNVEVRFADEPGDEPSYVDQSRSMNEVLGRPVEVSDK